MIPITFNHDDLTNEKKGNIRGQDFASFISFAYSKQAGILDVFSDNCSITAVAQNTPTGYATLTFSKGYICVFGRIIYIEENEQVQVALPTDTSTVTGTLGVRINLGETGANEVTWFTKTTALQTDDILKNQVNGIYEFALYNYTATNSSFTLGNKIASTIQSLPAYLSGANFTTPNTNDNSKKLATTEFVNNVIANNMTKISGGNREVTTENPYSHLWTSYTIGNFRVLYGWIQIDAKKTFTIEFGNLFNNNNYSQTVTLTNSFTQSSDGYSERNATVRNMTTHSVTIYNPSTAANSINFIIMGDKA